MHRDLVRNSVRNGKAFPMSDFLRICSSPHRRLLVRGDTASCTLFALTSSRAGLESHNRLTERAALGGSSNNVPQTRLLEAPEWSSCEKFILRNGVVLTLKCVGRRNACVARLSERDCGDARCSEPPQDMSVLHEPSSRSSDVHFVDSAVALETRLWPQIPTQVRAAPANRGVRTNKATPRADGSVGPLSAQKQTKKESVFFFMHTLTAALGVPARTLQ